MSPVMTPGSTVTIRFSLSISRIRFIFSSREDDAAADGHGAAAQAVSGAAGRHRDALSPGQAKELGDLSGASGPHDNFRRRPQPGDFVVGVFFEILVKNEDVLRAGDPPQRLDDRGVHFPVGPIEFVHSLFP